MYTELLAEMQPFLFKGEDRSFFDLRDCIHAIRPGYL